jgi:hypothetical protein
MVVRVRQLRGELQKGREEIPQRLTPELFCCEDGTAEGRAPSKQHFSPSCEAVPLQRAGYFRRLARAIFR